MYFTWAQGEKHMSITVYVWKSEENQNSLIFPILGDSQESNLGGQLDSKCFYPLNCFSSPRYLFFQSHFLLLFSNVTRRLTFENRLWFIEMWHYLCETRCSLYDLAKKSSLPFHWKVVSFQSFISWLGFITAVEIYLLKHLLLLFILLLRHFVCESVYSNKTQDNLAT